MHSKQKLSFQVRTIVPDWSQSDLVFVLYLSFRTGSSLVEGQVCGVYAARGEHRRQLCVQEAVRQARCRPAKETKAEADSERDLQDDVFA